MNTERLYVVAIVRQAGALGAWEERLMELDIQAGLSVEKRTEQVICDLGKSGLEVNMVTTSTTPITFEKDKA